MAERLSKPVFVLDGDFVHVSSSRCPLSVCAHPQDKGKTAVWIAKQTTSWFSVSFFWVQAVNLLINKEGRKEKVTRGKVIHAAWTPVPHSIEKPFKVNLTTTDLCTVLMRSLQMMPTLMDTGPLRNFKNPVGDEVQISLVL